MTLNMPYDEVVKRIVAETDLSKEEVIEKINEKVKELGSLITPEGAAHIIARELEINLYDSQSIKKPQPTSISDLMGGMNNVTITALVKGVYEPKNFSRSDGTQGAVQNLHLIDKTGYCRLVLWDTQIGQFGDMGISKGTILRISGAFVKESQFDKVKEISLSSRSQIEIDPKDAKKSNFPESLLSFQKINTMQLGLTDVELVGRIVAIRPISSFTKKDGSEGQISAIEIADETGKIKITLWDDKADIIENLKIDNVIEVLGGYTRQGLNDSIEVHLGKNGTINKNNKVKIDVPKEILESKSIITAQKTSSSPSEEVRLSDLKENMKNISIIARITGTSSIREFDRKDGTESKVGSLLVSDNSGPGKVTLWNSMTDYIKKVEIGDVIRIEGAYVKLGLRGEPEVHVGSNTTIEINPEYLKDAIPELELNFIDIASLKPNERDVNVKALVMRVQDIRSFSKSDGNEGRVLNIGIGDQTGSTRLVAWDEKAIELEHMEEMSPIEVLHGYTKEGNQGVEIHLGKLSTVRKMKNADSFDISKIKSFQQSSDSSSTKRVDMIDLEEGEYVEIRGTILKVYEGKMYYHSCPECRKKVTEIEDGKSQCEEHGTIEPSQTIFVSIALDDGTGCVRVTFFRDLAQQLLDVSPESIIDEIEQVGIQPVILKLEQRIKGREIIVKGRPRKNKFDDGMDLIANSFTDSDPKTEIELVKSSLKA
ncbi:MAG TPA: DUF2240 family protein [candidate division Zixibacteria bacterium]|nr:DUF2240 family protein [candidate division Zixibacteria bacterium]